MDRVVAVGAVCLVLAAAVGGYASFGVDTDTSGPSRENRAYVAAPLSGASADTRDLGTERYEDFEERVLASLGTVRSWHGYDAPERTRAALRAARNGTVAVENSTVAADLTHLFDGAALLAVDEQHYRYSLSRENGTTALTGTYVNATETRRYVLAQATIAYESLNASERATFTRLRDGYRRDDVAGYYPLSNQTLTDRAVLVERNGTRYVIEDTFVHAGGIEESAITRLLLWIVAGVVGAIGLTVLAARRWRPE